MGIGFSSTHSFNGSVDRGCNVAVRVGFTGNSGIAILGSQRNKAKSASIDSHEYSNRDRVWMS